MIAIITVIPADGNRTIPGRLRVGPGGYWLFRPRLLRSDLVC